jgi:hypothetical protein
VPTESSFFTPHESISGGHYDAIAFLTSSDGGATWSASVGANTPTGLPAFTPSVDVNSAGTVGVTYYDMRNLSTRSAPVLTEAG